MNPNPKVCLQVLPNIYERMKAAVGLLASHISAEYIA